MWYNIVGVLMNHMVTLDEKEPFAYSLTWGQCSKIMRSKVEANNNSVEARREVYVLSLLEFVNYFSYN